MQSHIQQIILKEIGKKYNRDWIFKNVNLVFETNKSYAILGPNGSGKSTLLQVIAGNLMPTNGTVSISSVSAEIDVEVIYKHVSICAPYLQLIEEMNLAELIAFHTKFKKLLINDVVEVLQLEKAGYKEIRQYSSGMKQRVKLGLAILSADEILILDEPLTNLDEQGKQWYYNMIDQYAKNKIIIVGSNRADEYAFCEQKISIEEYKT